MLIVVAPWLVGCVPCPPETGELHLTWVGTGEAPVPERGPQGGQHLWLEVVIEGLGAAPWSFSLGLRAEVSQATVGEWRRELPDPREPGSMEPALLPGLQLVITRWPTDEPRELVAEATDQCGAWGVAVWDLP